MNYSEKNEELNFIQYLRGLMLFSGIDNFEKGKKQYQVRLKTGEDQKENELYEYYNSGFNYRNSLNQVQNIHSPQLVRTLSTHHWSYALEKMINTRTKFIFVASVNSLNSSQTWEYYLVYYKNETYKISISTDVNTKKKTFYWSEY